MIIPIGDDNPVERFPYVNIGIIAINAVVFFYLGFRHDYLDWVRMYGLVPEHVELYRFLTHMFMHGGLFHLVGNMLFLAILGNNIEDRLGHAGYLFFYLAAGFVAANLDIAIANRTVSGELPRIGASGAVAGIMAAYAAFFPRNQIKFFYWVGFIFFGTFYLASAWAIGFWFVLQLLMSLFTLHSGMVTGVAYWSHVGGFGAGFVAALVFNQIVPREELERSIAMFLAQGKPDRAIDRYERLRKRFPWRTLSPILQYAIAETYEQQFMFSKASDAYGLFAKNYPENPRTSEAHAKVAALCGARPLDAISLREDESTVHEQHAPMPGRGGALVVDGGVIDAVAHASSLGREYFRSKQWDRAIEQFNTVLERDPCSIEAYAYLGAAYYQQGLPTEAIRPLEEAVKVGGRSPVLYNNLAVAYLAAGRRKDAADAWHRTLKLDPRNKTARSGLRQLRASRRSV